MACSSEAQAPRSINLQRSEQKGLLGLCGPHSTAAPQVGQATKVGVLMFGLRVGLGKSDEGAALHLATSSNRDHSPAHHVHGSSVARGWLEP